MAGIHLLPLLGGSGLGSAIGGLSSSRGNYTFWVLLSASGFVLLGSGLLSSIPEEIHVPVRQYGYQIILGFGIGMTISAGTLLVIIETEFEDHGNRPTK